VSQQHWYNHSRMERWKAVWQRDLIFWPGVVLLALLARGVQLTDAPLGPREADIAYRAAQLARGVPVDIGPGGWLTGLLSGLFFLTGPQRLWARALPWLGGAMLPLLARGAQSWLGRTRARWLALAWALDPALVAASRVAWGPALAITLLLFAYGLAWHGWRTLALVLGLAALGMGPGAALGWPFALALVFGWWTAGRPSARADREAGLVLAAVLLLLISGWGLAPQALFAWASGVVHYVRTWHYVGAPIALALVLLLPLLLARTSFESRASRADMERGLLVAGMWALAVWLLTPHRQGADLAWVTVALWPWAIAAAPRVRPEHAGWWLGPAVAGFAVGFLLFYAQWLTPAMSASPLLRVALLGVSLLLWVFLFIYLTSWLGSDAARWVWTWVSAAWVLVLVGMGLRHAWRAAWGDEWWQVPGASVDLEALEQTMAQWGAWRFRRGDALPGAILARHPNLRWLHARAFPEMRERVALQPDEAPPAVLAWEPVQLPRAYRGQRFTLTEHPPSQLALGDFWPWFAYGQTTTQGLDVILLLREDLFWDARPDVTEATR